MPRTVSSCQIPDHPVADGKGAEEALAKAIAGFRELREIVTEQLKVIRAAQR